MIRTKEFTGEAAGIDMNTWLHLMGSSIKVKNIIQAKEPCLKDIGVFKTVMSTSFKYSVLFEIIDSKKYKSYSNEYSRMQSDELDAELNTQKEMSKIINNMTKGND